mgnify:CR=1 FL=1
MNKKLVEVVAAVIENENNEILCALRSPIMTLPNMWEFPGGKIELGESREEALIREVKEELELDINNLEYLTTVEYDYPNFHLTMHCFICEICGGELVLNAHNDAKWVSLEELSTQKWVPADVEVVEKILNDFKINKID